MKRILVVLFLFGTTGLSSNLSENITESLLENKLTLQLGFEIPFLITPGLALTNNASQPIFTLSTNFLGLIARVTINTPSFLETQKLVEDLIKTHPALTEKELFKMARDKILASKVLIFIEGGGMVIPLIGDRDIEWYFIPFIGLGFYFPVGTTNSFLTLRLNFPLVGGIGLVYIF